MSEPEYGRLTGRAAGPIAYLYELDEPGVGGRWSGTFVAECKRADGEWVHGPERVGVEAGLAWARERAPVVLIRLGSDNDFYSAGPEAIPDVPRVWPEGTKVLPRPFGEPPDAPRQRVPWAVNVGIPGTGDAGRRHAAAMRDWLAATGRLESVEVAEPAPGGFRLECVVVAGSIDEAVLDVDALLPDEYFDEVPDSGGGWSSVVSYVGRVVDG